MKPITELSTKELLQIVEKVSNTHSYSFKKDVIEFISIYKLQKGEYRVLGKLIYKLYSKWSPNPLDYQLFIVEFTQFFPSIRYGKGTMYEINRKDLFIKAEFEELNKKSFPKIKIKKWGEHYQRFLMKYQVKKGRFFIKDVVLYNIYDKWAYKNKRSDSLTLYQFNKFCKVFFKHKIIKKHMWFAIDPSIKNHLTPNLWNLMNEKEKKSKIPG